jgi:hypothetical protein
MFVSMPSARFAAIATTIVGLGALGFALLLFAIAQSGIGTLRLPGVGSVLVALAVVTALFGAVALGAAIGLWRGAGWAVVVGAIVHATALTGVLVAAETGGVGPHIVAGTFLTVAGLLTLTPSLRGPLVGSEPVARPS